MHYTNIPWRLFRNISLLLFLSRRHNRPDDTSLIVSLLSQFSNEFKMLLPAIENLINFEISVACNKPDFAILPSNLIPENSYLTLFLFGNYAGNIIFLRKIIEELTRDQILKHLSDKSQADGVKQSDFFALIDNFSLLTNRQKKEIKEYYKQLRQGNAKSTKFDNIKKILNGIKFISDEEFKKSTDGFINNLKQFNNTQSLESALGELGLLDVKDIWEEKRTII